MLTLPVVRPELCLTDQHHTQYADDAADRGHAFLQVAGLLVAQSEVSSQCRQ